MEELPLEVYGQRKQSALEKTFQRLEDNICYMSDLEFEVSRFLLSIYLFIYLFICLSVCFLVYFFLFIYLFSYLVIYLFSLSSLTNHITTFLSLRICHPLTFKT